MKRAVLVMAGAVVALAGMPQRMSAQTVAACTSNCAQVSITPANVNASQNGVATVGLTFQQAPSNGQAGGPDEIAAVALTLRLTGDLATSPLQLNDCTLTADGLPGAVKPDASISNFKVVVENVSCANGRTHCLCPDSGSGIAPDNFINLVVYGPNPLPTPGPNPVTIPTLPDGPLLTIDLKVAANASGTIPLHVYNQVQDSQHPQFTAFLSVGDKVAVDQTCVPVTGQPPCSGAGATSQVATVDGSIVVTVSCTGDCDGSGDVTVNELITMVNIALGNAQLSACPAGDADGSGDITINEIIAAVNFALGSCPH